MRAVLDSAPPFTDRDDGAVAHGLVKRITTKMIAIAPWPLSILATLSHWQEGDHRALRGEVMEEEPCCWPALERGLLST